ncbi:Aste57867_4026 [Aphanomyces stellatus]|uniref:Long-chain-fatty-acid--CoA ligase n=1 Tax=Aphanomyces stellatus TaxID=120398 RepID=A0A485KG54_9STRA|nr:hypothetical protein As57867_004015 [Aphanomyces stellatus]VFT81161.1 Aste57867_4026 [Aphanomyces stellatus]
MLRHVLLATAGVVALGTEVPKLDESILQTYKVPAPNDVEFGRLVAETDVVFAKFFAPWCGHCKSLAPAWKELSATFAPLDNVKVVDVDCDAHGDLCSAHDIQGYPTLKLYRNNQYEEYQGQRTLKALTDFLLARIDAPTYSFAGMGNAPTPVLQAILVVVLTFVLGFASAVYFFCLRPTHRANPPKFYALPDKSTAKRGHGPVYKVGSFPSPKVSLLETLEATVKATPNGPFLGRRPIDAAGHAGPYVWESYGDAYTRIQNFSSGLQHEKMIETNADGHRIVCIFMKNRPEYVLAQYAAFYAGGSFCSLYETLGASSTAFILNQTQIATVVCTSAELKTILELKPLVKTLLFVVLSDVVMTAPADVDAAAALGLKLVTFRAIEQIGATHPRAATHPKVSDLSFLMYTSGTTGDPKGVQLSHGNLLSVAAGAEERLKRGRCVLPFSTQGVHLSYLPLPHILEQLIHAIMVAHGGRIGFFQGDTRKLPDDLAALEPTHFITVPRLLNRMYDKVVQMGKAAGGVKGWLFAHAMETKLANLKHGYQNHPLFDKLIFSKIQKKLGFGRCHFILTGSAPVADDVLAFFRIMLDCPVMEGYGQSECTGASNITDIEDVTTGTVGAPMCCTEVKLISVPEMGYEVTDSVHGDKSPIPVNGRGEICYRGPAVFAGYYKAPDKTAEAIDADGWLHSGDIGVWTLDGRLKIIDRKKNIFKLSQGEYVAPEKIENVLKGSEYVGQSFVYGDSLHSILVGIVVPDAHAIKKLAAKLNVAGTTVAELCKSPEIVATIQKDITAVGKKGGLSGFETVRAIHLHPDAFTVENDMLTPTFKLKRNEAKKMFADEIDALYHKAGDLVAGKNVKQG